MDSTTKTVNEDVPNKASTSTADSSKKNRRGKGSKSKQAEMFRAKKNKEFDKILLKKIDDIKISFGYNSKDLFGDRMLTSIVRPQVKIPVSLTQVGALATLVAEVLHHACKIPPPPEADEDAIVAFDDETLKWVTSLQLEAKIYYARAGSQFPDTDLSVCDCVRRTAQLLSRALTPLAIVIDQIGRFLFQEQLFIPLPNGDDDFIYGCLQNPDNTARMHFGSLVLEPQRGMRTDFKDHQDKTMYAFANPEDLARLIELGITDMEGNFTQAFLANPSVFPYFDLIRFEPEHNPPAPPTFSEIARRYAELEGRVSKKLANVFAEVELSKGLGVESQIVFREMMSDGTCTARSPRMVRADVLELGAILGLGYPCPIGVRECAVCQCTIDTSAGLENLANILTKKLR